jgi:hypothetical protein
MSPAEPIAEVPETRQSDPQREWLACTQRYALWRGGLLCYTLDENGPFPLDTSILNSLTGDVFAPLFPEAKPVTLQTSPKAPPTTAFDGSHAIDVNLDRLGLDMYAELDGRQAKVVTIDLSGVVGADLAFDATTGALGVVVDLDPAALTPTIGYNEFYPDANETIVSSFSGAFGGGSRIGPPASLSQNGRPARGG